MMMDFPVSEAPGFVHWHEVAEIAWYVFSFLLSDDLRIGCATLSQRLSQMANDNQLWSALLEKDFHLHRSAVVVSRVPVGAPISYKGAYKAAWAAHQFGWPLGNAVASGDIPAVNALIDANCNISKVEDGGWGIVHVAVESGHAEVVDVLATLGADIDLADADGLTPLWFAAANGRVDCIRVLLKHGVDANRPDEAGQGWTPLFVAAKHGHADAIEILVCEGGADVNKGRNDGRMPLDAAVLHGCDDAAEVLRKYGARRAAGGGHSEPDP